MFAKPAGDGFGLILGFPNGQVTAGLSDRVVMDALAQFLAEVLNQYQINYDTEASDVPSVDDGRNMTEARRQRAYTCKEIKDTHLDWSYAKVAMAATDKLKEEVTEYDVRNDYRAMGWTWERADRVR